MRRPATVRSMSVSGAAARADASVAQTVQNVLEGLAEGDGQFIASAPGRLDVMGGIAEYTGGLVLHIPLARRVCVGMVRRGDGVVSVIDGMSHQAAKANSIEVACRDLFGADGTPIEAARGRRIGAEAGVNNTLRSVLGVLVEASRLGLVSDVNRGCTIVVESSLSGLTDAGHDAALAAGTLVALARMLEVTLDPDLAVAVCRQVQTDWLGSCAGTADAACALLGEAHALSQLRCDPCTLVGSIRLPDDLCFIGVDSGVLQANARDKYDRARCAAFMGRTLIERIIRHDGADNARWDGYLARVSVTDYVDCFRDRLPTKLKGREFLDRFGETGDPLTRIDPDFVYKIRSRTEHHIYEHARSCQFAEYLSRALRTNDAAALREAGELMYASHWSYGQRCGLGSVETDALVALIRQYGAEADIYGAKISGRGCGGVVAVFMQATDQARAALNSATDAYRERTGHTATLLEGSSPGGLVGGARVR